MVRKLGGEEDKYGQTDSALIQLLTFAYLASFVSYTTSQYKLHYYETPTNIKFVMLTDLKSPSMRIALQQIYINLFVEYGQSAHWLYLRSVLTLVQLSRIHSRRSSTPEASASTMSFSKSRWNSSWFVYPHVSGKPPLC